MATESAQHKEYYHRHRKKSPAKLIYMIASILFLFFIVGIVGSAGVVAYYSSQLPSPNELITRKVAQSTTIYSRNGDVLYDIYGDQNRSLVTLDGVSKNVIDATLAAEDPNFYTHKGVDFRGIMRAFYTNITNQGFAGGSTISQQLVKKALLSDERTLSRKIKELILTIEIERKYTKDEILQMYLNEIPYGGTAYGVKAASKTYFDKDPKDLSLAEAALIAGLPQSPSYYSPFGAYPENAKGRQTYVLHLMQTHGYITEEQAEEAKNEELHFASQVTNIEAPHFVMYVKSILTEKYGDKLVEQGGLKVTTTLDLGMQKIAEEEARFNIDRLAAQNANARNSSLVAIDPRTGEILTMMGSVDYFDTANDGNVNVSLAERQPGSSIKPITYITGFMKGYTAATFLSDIRTEWPSVGEPFIPVESDGKYWGPILVRDALANSRNVPAVKMLQLVTIPEMLKTAHAMGITTLNEPDRYGLALTLGGGEVKLLDLTSAYGVFANGGVRHEPVAILKVEDANGKILEEYKPGDGKRVFEEKYAYLISDIMSDNVARTRLFGSGNLLQIRDWKAAVKTGTTNENKDAWTIGYTPTLVTGVWTGNNNNESMNGIQGSTGATPLWHYFMERVLENRDRGTFTKPEKDFVSLQIDALSGKLPGPSSTQTRWEIFIKGTQPTETDDFHEKVDVCKGTDLLARPYHKLLGLSETKTYTMLKEVNSSWQPFTNAWMASQSGYGAIPTEHCSGYSGNDNAQIVVQIQSPLDNATVLSDFDVIPTILSPAEIEKVDYYFDSTLYKSLTKEPYTVTFHLSPTVLGYHTIMVRATDKNGKVGEASVTVNVAIEPNGGPPTTPSAR